MVAAFLVATIVAWTRPNQWGWFGFLGAWFFLILGPSSSFVPIVTEIAAERRFYIAVVSVLLLLFVGAEEARRRVAQSDPASARRWLVAVPAAVGLYYLVAAIWKAQHLTSALAAQMAFCLGVGGGAALLAWLLVRGLGRPWIVVGLCGALACTTFSRSVTYDDPEALWRDAVVKMPKNARAIEALGTTIWNKDSTRAVVAESLFYKAIDSDSLYESAYFNAGGSALDQGLRAKARALFEKAVSINPSYLPALTSLGNMLLVDGEPAKAIPYLERGSTRPLTDEVLIDLGTAYMLTGRLDESIQIFQRVLAHDPGRPDALRYVGMMYVQLGEAPQAIPYLERAVQNDPRASIGLALLGLAYAQTGHADEATQAATLAARIGNGDARTLQFAGRAMIDAKHPEDAERYLTHATQIDANDPETLTWLGKAKASLGKRAEAADSYRRALAVAPGYEPARQALSELGGGRDR